MAKTNSYMALFVEKIEKRSEPVFLRFTPAVRITARPIFAMTGVSDRVFGDPAKTYSPITGQTKEEVGQELERQRAENNLFLPSLRKLPKDAEVIVVSL